MATRGSARLEPEEPPMPGSTSPLTAGNADPAVYALTNINPPSHNAVAGDGAPLIGGLLGRNCSKPGISAWIIAKLPTNTRNAAAPFGDHKAAHTNKPQPATQHIPFAGCRPNLQPNNQSGSVRKAGQP